MRQLIVILHCGRQHEPATRDDVGDRHARAVDLIGGVGTEMNEATERARFHVLTLTWAQERVDIGANIGCAPTAMPTHWQDLHVVKRLREPASGSGRLQTRRDGGEHIEQDRGGVANARESGAPFTGGIADPDPDDDIRRDPDGPGVAAAEASACLPGDALHGAEHLPLSLLLRAIEQTESLERGPSRSWANGAHWSRGWDVGRIETKGEDADGVGASETWRRERDISQREQRARQGGIHAAQVPQRALGAA